MNDERQNPPHSGQEKREDDGISATLRVQLDKVRRESAAAGNFHWKTGAWMALLTFVAFFLFGFIARAPFGSCLGFAGIGALCGFFVGACRPVK